MTPTLKQIAYANRIAQTLEIDFPTNAKDFTRANYRNFIAQHVIEYRQIINEGHCDEDFLQWAGLYENDVWCEHY